MDGSRIRGEEQIDADLIFEKCAEAIWRWLSSRFGELIPDMPQEARSFQGETIGYRISLDMDAQKRSLNMSTMHLDMEVGGRLWNSRAQLEQNEEGQMILDVYNGYAEPQQELDVPETPGTFFSYPGFYKSIVDSVGILDGVECSNRRRILREDQVEELSRAILDPRRQFPIILIVSKENEDGMMDESWLDQFRVSDFTRTVWRYTHVFTSYEQTGKKVLAVRGLDKDPEAVPRLYIFWPDQAVDAYGPEDVANCTFGRHLEARDDARTYDIVHGGQAFYHQIVADLRDSFVSD